MSAHDTSRRAAVEQAFAKASRPAPVRPFARPVHSDLELIGETVRSEHRAGRIAPGGMTAVIQSLPTETAFAVCAAVDACGNQQELGRHGDVDRVSTTFEVDRPLLEVVTDQVDVDYVCHQLQARRGSDADLPVPELTRRDYLSAALDAHSEE
jgi:hypothetical protein